jgi:hypothetical protein
MMANNPKDPNPSDPFGPLAEGAITTHELFKAYMTAGFTRREALDIVTGIVRESVRLSAGK